MRSRSALFVDAGYLMAAAATRLTGSSLRRGISVDYQALVAALAAYVEDGTGLPLLRIYWYDAGRNGLADDTQEKIAALPKVKLRLGRVGMDGEQKGVDLRIGLDMVGHSRNGAVDTVYLLSGDDDLTEAVEEAQAQGMQVRVLAVPTASGAAHGVSRHLVQAADGVEILSAGILDAAISSATVDIPVPARTTAPTDSIARLPNPAEVAKRGATPAPALAYSGSSGSRPFVAPEFQRDPSELSTAITDVVTKAYLSWSKTATNAQREELMAARPTIPRELDRALLVDMSDVLGDYFLSDDLRVQLRARFWDAVDAAA